jgi:hypothetical protein
MEKGHVRPARSGLRNQQDGITVAVTREDALGMSATQIKGGLMNSLSRLVVRMGLLSLLSVLPLAAQIDNVMGFTTSFPFYAGNARMPAGSYKITPSGFDTAVLLIKSKDGAYSAFVDFIPTHAEQPHPQSDVTFHKYGDTDYLNRIWVNGQRYGMRVDPTKAETHAAASTNVVEHSLVADKN